MFGKFEVLNEVKEEETVMVKRKRGRKLGFKMTQASRDKMSESHMGMTQPQEIKDKIGNSMKKVWSDLKEAAARNKEKI